MVFLIVKGTKFPDEFTYQCDASTPINPPDTAEVATAAAGDAPPQPASQTRLGVAQCVAHLLNSRHQLRMLLLSAQELAKERRAMLEKENREANTQEVERALDTYACLVEDAFVNLKDSTTPIVDDATYDAILEDLRTRTTQLFPTYCTHADGTEAAIQNLYQQHDENPDLPENERLIMYHCRAIIDPKWNARERLDESDAGLWFCGKPMEKPTLREYCGRNEKSKLTVKAASRKGPAPSGEPRMSYEDQRALFAHMRAKRETLKNLEESELRDRVLQKSRGAVRMPTGSGASDGTLQTQSLRPIFSNKQERIVGED